MVIVLLRTSEHVESTVQTSSRPPMLFFGKAQSLLPPYPADTQALIGIDHASEATASHCGFHFLVNLLPVFGAGAMCFRGCLSTTAQSPTVL